MPRLASPLLRPIETWPMALRQAVTAFEQQTQALIQDRNLSFDDKVAPLHQAIRDFEPHLASLPVPQMHAPAWTPSQYRRQRDAKVDDTANLFFASMALMGPHQIVGDWSEGDRRSVARALGKAPSGFRNYDGLFGFWWFQVEDHP
jgi:hypothetical protein